MKRSLAGRGMPMWGIGWGGFLVVVIAALCVSALQAFRPPHARAGDGKITSYGVSRLLAVPSDKDANRK